MKKKTGSILLYTLIILSTLSVFLAEFIFFTRNRHKVLYLKEKSPYEFKETILEKEKEFSEITFKNGVLYDGIKISLSKEDEYYDSKIIEINEPSGKKLSLEKLIYLNKDILSIGNFQIKEIRDNNNNPYSLPLNKNTVYPELKITYEKIVLNQNIIIIEGIKFTRKDSDEVIIESTNFQIMGE